jgi:hypothetical protein
MPHPADAGRTVQVFSDWRKACEHLRDHVLTAPESEAWAVVMSGYGQVIDPADEEERWRYLREAVASRGVTAQPLYDLYGAAVVRDAEDSVRLGWWRSDGGVTVAVGSSGILMVVEGVLRTAFLPGQGGPEQTRLGKLQGAQTALPRQRGMRSGRAGRFARDEAGKDLREREAREAHWTEAERLYYRIFRPAVQFIRKCHHRQRDMTGRLVRRDYALLKDSLPPRSRLKFQDWVFLRERCGRKVSANGDR